MSNNDKPLIKTVDFYGTDIQVDKEQYLFKCIDNYLEPITPTIIEGLTVGNIYKGNYMIDRNLSIDYDYMLIEDDNNELTILGAFRFEEVTS